MNEEITAQTFIELWTNQALSSQQPDMPNYPALAKRLQSGELALFLGTDLPAICDEKYLKIEEIASQLAEEVKYDDNRSYFPEISEYIDINRELGINRVYQKLTSTLLQPTSVKPLLPYELLAKKA